MTGHEGSARPVSDGAAEAARVARRPTTTNPPKDRDDDPRCGARFDVHPHEGLIRCELDAGHAARWHSNEAAGYEWSGRVLWLLPRSATRAA